MLISQKKIYRPPVLHTATHGVVPHSIDSKLRDIPVEVDPWDTIYLLGAQLCRPPFDPYRETIDTRLVLGTGEHKLILDMPILLGSENGVPAFAYQTIHGALENIGRQGNVYAVISPFVPAEEYRSHRNHAIILKDGINQPDINFADAFSTKNDPERIKQLKPYEKPVLVYTQNPNEIPHALDAGADAIIFVLPSDPLEQLKAIIAAKQQFADYFRGAEIDRKLLFANGINDTGRLMKAIAMGATTAHGAVYDIPSLIATIPEPSSNNGQYTPQDISRLVENILSGTYTEITQLSGAPGYSRYDNLSHPDLRTSSTKVSMITGIEMEGLGVSWLDWHKRILEQDLAKKGIEVEPETLDQMVLTLIEKCK